MRRKDLENEFMEILQQRWKAGDEEYGDGSFEGPLAPTLKEIEEELLDVCGWSFVMWVKIQKLKKAVASLNVEISK